MKQFWLMKSEPTTFSLDDLQQCTGQREPWNGVRNYQARNYMRDTMRVGDEVLFYHSNCKPAGVVGIARVASNAYPDPTALDPNSEYYDAKSTAENPRWFLVDVQFVKCFKRMVTLEELKQTPELASMKVVQRGQRLSIQPVTADEFSRVCKLGMSRA